MKNIAIIIMIMLSSFSTVAQASLRDNNHWYVGSKLGWSQFHNTNKLDNYLSNDGNLTCKNNLGVGIFSGYRINQYFSMEAGYDWLDRIIFKRDNDIDHTFKSHGIQLAAKIDYPMTKNMDIYTRLGGMIWRADCRNNASDTNNHDTGISPMFAGGIEWMISDNISSRLEYQWTNNIGDSNIVRVRPDNSMLSLGVSYHFGQQKDTSVAIMSAPISNSATHLNNKHFSLKSSVLFNFNEATLSLEGQQILDQLFTQLNNLDSKDYSIIVLGFSDNIGSSVYNRNLSERRSQSVVEYLIYKGIPENKISSHGMGESNPVTGNTCNNIENRSKLINCLSPDRRVEIEVKGIKY